MAHKSIPHIARATLNRRLLLHEDGHIDMYNEIPAIILESAPRNTAPAIFVPMRQTVKEAFQDADYTIEESVGYLQNPIEKDEWTSVDLMLFISKLQDLNDFISDNTEQIVMYEQNCKDTESFVNKYCAMLNLGDQKPTLPLFEGLYDECTELRDLLVGIRNQADKLEHEDEY